MLSIVVVFVGDLLRVEREAAALLQWISEHPDTAAADLEWLLVFDGPQWNKVLAPSRLGMTSRPVRPILVPESCDHPGVLFNHGLRAAQQEFVAFAWPGCSGHGRVGAWRALCMAAESRKWVFAAGVPPSGERQNSPFDSWLAQPRQAIRGYHRGWLQMQSLVPMSNSIVRREFLQQTGGFSPSCLLARYGWWELTLRASRTQTIEMLPDIAGSAVRWGWHNYPLARTHPAGADLVARLLGQDLLPRYAPEEALRPNQDGIGALARDLPPESAARLMRWGRNHPRSSEQDHPSSTAPVRWRRPLRITVVGGVHEPAHNQLCFFNYFQRIAGQGLISWRTLLDSAAQPADLLQVDLAIFSRIRSDAGRALLETCAQRGIATLYMLDDNWLWIGRDVPDVYGEMFKPGAPSYENFLACCRTADAVLTYNPLLAEDLEPHAKRVLRIRTNIDLAQFPRRPRDPSRPPLLGYVGSTRWVQGAFDGLVAVARQCPDVRLFVMTNKPPEALAVLPTEQVRFQAYVYSYERYAQLVCEAAPDVLIAPLERSRYQSSKCPNKYLEITAVGAAGVYSRTEPYTSVVRDGETGLFADDNQASWTSALLQLIHDPSLRRRIAANALEHVEREYRTESVLPEFLTMLETVYGKPIALPDPE